MNGILATRRVKRLLTGFVTLAASAAVIGQVASPAVAASPLTIRNQAGQALQANIANNSQVVLGFYNGTSSGQWEKRPSPT